MSFKGHEKGHLQVDQVVQIPIQPGLEFFQGCGIYQQSLSNLAPRFTVLVVKNCFLIFGLKLPSFSLKSLFLFLSLQALLKHLFSLFLQTPFRYSKAAIGSPWSLLLSPEWSWGGKSQKLRIHLTFWAVSTQCWTMSHFLSTRIPVFFPIPSSPSLYWYQRLLQHTCRTLYLVL